MKANVCGITYCDECKAFEQVNDVCRCGKTGELLRWFQYACKDIDPKDQEEAPKEAVSEAYTAEMKRCPRCGQYKPLEAFSANASSTDGKQTWCRECMNEKARLTYQKKKSEREV